DRSAAVGDFDGSPAVVAGNAQLGAEREARIRRDESSAVVTDLASAGGQTHRAGAAAFLARAVRGDFHVNYAAPFDLNRSRFGRGDIGRLVQQLDRLRLWCKSRAGELRGSIIDRR